MSIKHETLQVGMSSTLRHYNHVRKYEFSRWKDWVYEKSRNCLLVV